MSFGAFPKTELSGNRRISGYESEGKAIP